jgi:hypothetical protein
MVCGRLRVRDPIGYNQRLLNWYLLQVNLQWDDDEVIFVLDQHAYCWISIVLAHRNNSPQIDMSDTSSL